MFYDYKCPNKECNNAYRIVTIEKPMKEVSRQENCPLCGCLLERTLESFISSYECKCGGFYGKESR